MCYLTAKVKANHGSKKNAIYCQQIGTLRSKPQGASAFCMFLCRALIRNQQKHKRPEGGPPRLATGGGSFGVHSFAYGDFMVPKRGYIFDSGPLNRSFGAFRAKENLKKNRNIKDRRPALVIQPMLECSSLNSNGP